MDSFVDMLWDQDVDMGVDRYFYDPVLREQHVKKQEAEQNKLQELKKRHAQQETKRFIIDEETGERIPDPSASSRSLCTFSEETDLSKELVELAELDYLLGDMQAPDMSCQMKQVQQNNIPLIQPQQANYNSADMIVQTADQPNIPPDVDLWPTEITMLPGPSQAHPSTVHQLPYPTADTNPFISQIWGMEADTGCSTSGFYGHAGGPIVDTAPQFQSYEADTNDNIYHASTSPLFSAANSDSGVSLQDSLLDTIFDENGCVFSSPPCNEDIKPQFILTSESSSNHMASASSSSYFGSENGDSSSFMLNTQNEAGKEKRSICRDELRCKELEIPFTVSMITNYPVEEFNSLLRQHRLNEEQLTLVKDIRRRGKNKVAAQNCRKKKMNELTGLEAEINDLKRKRGELIRDKDELKRSKLHLRKQLDQTYIEVFNSVRDNLGRPYDPRYYTLHISDDGDAHIIPNKVNSFSMASYHHTA